jgi:FkbM family methyltransferase
MASFKRWLDRRRNPWKGVFHDAFLTWRRENGAQRLYDYAAMPSGAVVFDFGGYKGEWADRVLAHQGQSILHVFEPHPGFAAELSAKYTNDARVNVYDYGLGAQNGEIALSDEKNASSAVADHAKGLAAKIVSVAQFFANTDIPKIDLVKMNIEGGEYDLLPALIESGVIKRMDRLQVQFHLFEPGMIAQREAIRTQLEATHDCVWCYPFVWEEWRLRR